MSRRPEPGIVGAAWLAWGLGAAFYAYGFFQRVAPAVMVDALMRDFALGGALIGSLSAAYFYAYAAVQIPVGVLLDRFGPRRLLLAATLLAALGGAMFALAPGLLPALAGRVLVGAAVGVAFIATLKLASLCFPPARFGLVAGLTLAVGVLGGIVAQAPLGALVDLLGWRKAMLLAALAALALGLAILVLLPARHAARGASRRDPPGAGRAAEPVDAEKNVAAGGLRAIAGTLPVWLLTAYASCMGAPILALAGLWLVPYLAQVHDLPRAEAGALASVMLAAWAIGGPAAGWLADRLGRLRAMRAAAALNAACLATLCLVPAPPLLLIAALSAVIGLGGGFMIASYAHARELYGTAHAATAMGIVNSAVLLVGAVLQSLIGHLLDLRWTGETLAGARLYPEAAYRHAFLLLLLVSGLALASAILLRARRPGGEAA